MAFNRELSQFAGYLELDAAGNYIGIAGRESTAKVGIGRTDPTSKLDVSGDARVSGVMTATTFYGNLDYSYVTNKSVGVRTEISVVDNGGDGSLSYNNVTGIISYVGPSAADARAHFSATSSNLGSLSYSAETGVFAYSGVTTANIRDQFSASSADIGSLSYNSASGQFSLSGVTTSAIRSQFSGGTGVTITNGSVAIGQPVGTTDSVTFASVNSTGIVTASALYLGAEGSALRVSSDRITGPSTITLDPSGVGDNTGTVVIKGDLQIDGTTTTINSTTITIDDKNIQIADGAINDAAADGAGFTVSSGDGNKTFQFNDASDAFKSNISLDVASGQVYKINGTEVLSSNTLGSGVVNSSLTSVGTLTKLDVGNVNSTGIVTASGGFSGNVTGNVTGNLTGEVNAAAFDTNASGVVVTGVATATSGFSGNLTGNVTGNADTATKLQTARTIALSGDVVGEVSFDGSSNVSIAATIQPNSVALGGDTTGNYVATVADSGSSDIAVSGSGSETAAVTLGLTTTGVTAGSYGSSTQIPTFTVDSRGRLTAAGTAAVGAALTVAGDSGSETINFLNENLTISGGTNLTSSAANNTVTVNLDDNISLTSVVASGVITATSGFSGNVTGNLTGEVNAAAFDTNANGVVVTGVATATSGFSGNLTGNADTASKLQTARTIALSGDVVGEVSFDGSSNVSIAATIQPNSVALGGDTTGNYVATVADSGSSDIVVSGSGSETAAVTLGLSTTGVVAGSYGSSTQIPTFTVDSRGRLTAAGTASVGTALTVAGDSGSENINLLSETLTISGGTNLNSSASANSVTVNLDDNISLTSVVASGIVTAAQFVTGASGAAIGINTNTISGPATITLDPAGVGDNTGTVVIKGDLQIDGTTTTINSTTITVDDKNITLASGAINDAAADGGGITLESGDGNKTFNWVDATDSWTSSENMNLLSGKTYKINGTDVLSSNTLGSGVVNSSLTSVGTLGQLNVSGVTTSSGGFVGSLTGNASTATKLQTARTIALSGDVVGEVSFDGSANVSIAATIQPNSVALGGDTTGNYVATVADAGLSDIVVTGSGSETAAVTLGLNTTGVVAGSYGSSTQIPTFTVDSRGRLTAAGTASVGAALTVTGDSGSETINFLSENLAIAGGTNLTSSAAANTVTINLDDNISLTSVVASGVVTATSGFSGNLTGEVNATAFDTNVSGVVVTGVATATSGFSGNLTGNVTGNLTGNVYAASGISTFNNVALNGTVSAGSTIGTSNQVLISTGAGVTWTNLTNALPQLRTTSTVTATSGQTSFSFTYNVGYLDVFINGVKLSSSEFTATNGTGITLNEGAFAGDIVEFVSYATAGAGAGSVNSLNDLSDVTLTAPASGNILSYNGSEWVNTSTLSGITALDATTTATIENAVAAAPNNFTSLNITNSGVSTFSGLINANAGMVVTGVATATTFSGNLANTLTMATSGTGLSGSATFNNSGATTFTVTSNATSANTNSAIVARDAAGGFSAGIVTATQLSTGASGTGVNITTNTISGPSTLTIDPAGVGDNTGTVVIKGDLQIDGTTTTINSTVVTIDDLNITLASGAANAAAANGAGITIDGASATLTYASTNDKWVFNKDAEAPNFNTTSDRNLKENIRQVEGASELISKLEGVHFTWKENGKETIGVIAQQIEEHLPQLVQTGDTHKTVNYNGLIGVLIEAVKEQGEMIATLKAEIEELKK